MTGYGRGEAEGFGFRFLVELRSVNHRYSEIAVRLPKQYNLFEDQIRQRIQSTISRGRIDVYVTVENYETGKRKVVIDKELAFAYYNSLRELVQEFGFRDDLGVSILTRMPDIFTVEEETVPAEELWTVLEQALTQALDGLVLMRQAEGAKLQADLLQRADVILKRVADIERRAPLVVAEYREKLLKRITEMLGGVEVDQVRIAQEVALFADKSNVTEEIIRLYSHLAHFKDALTLSEPIGRKLDFMVQEMNREINTVGSKTGDIGIANQVVEVKSELEKIREQIQNIE